LALCGVDAWLDEWEIHLGQSLSDVLADAMSKSRFIGILMTDNYNTSVWTKTEYKRALSQVDVLKQIAPPFAVTS